MVRLDDEGSELHDARCNYCAYSLWLRLVFPGLIDDHHVNRASIWEHINFIGGNRICFLAFAISSDQKNFGLDVA